ncbi:MAG: AMP-binding protein, partial [Asticcacaulis sp.]
MGRESKAGEFKPEDLKVSLIEALVGAQAKFGAGKTIIEDQERKPLSYGLFLTGMFALSRLLKRKLGHETRIGLMLPTSLGGALSFWGLHALGKVPVMINFTAGQANIKAACQVSRTRTIVTARRFIENAKLEELVEAMSAYARIIYLDDIRKEITLRDKVMAVLAAKLPLAFAAKTAPS